MKKAKLFIAYMAMIFPQGLAQQLAQGPQLHLAQCSGANNNMVCRVPVFTVTGTTTNIFWWNVTFQFISNNTGDLFSISSPILTKAPDLPAGTGNGGGASASGTFVAGLYIQTGPQPSSARENTSWLIVTGPGPGGLYTAYAAENARCGFPQSATWYAGVPPGPSHPLGPRLAAAGITSSAVSYGSGGGLDLSICIGAPTGFREWYRQGSLLGFTQLNAKTLVITSYTNAGNRNKSNVPNEWEDDQSTPGGAVTYTFVSASIPPEMMPATP